MTDDMKNNVNLHIYVFSYNRGGFLRNCLLSLQRCAPDYLVTIIDDGSKDKTTIEVLDAWKNNCEVIVINNITGDSKTGGLHNNMNYALSHARKNQFQYILCIQDDMQLVRRIRIVDLQRAEQFFHANKNSFELQTAFFKEKYQVWDKDRMSLDVSGQAYIRKKIGRRPGNCGYSAVGLFDVDRFFDIFGTLESSEVANEMKARARGISLGFYIFPFMMWLPYPVSYRAKKRSLYLQTVEMIAGAGFHPIQYMSEEDEKKFISRPTEELPVAERFLYAPSCPYHKVWATEGGLDSLPPRGGWRNLLEKVLRRVDRASHYIKINKRRK